MRTHEIETGVWPVLAEFERLLQQLPDVPTTHALRAMFSILKAHEAQLEKLRIQNALIGGKGDG